MNSARLLASGRLAEELRLPAELGPQSGLNIELFIPLGLRPYRDQAAIVPTYPVGVPLHFAAASKLFGWHLGPLFIEVSGALAALCLCYLSGRELGLTPPLAAAGAAALAGCPLFVFTSIQPLSDTLACTWTLAAVFTALRARRRLVWAVACGTAFSIAVLVRPTNSVLLPALIVFLGLDWRRLALFVAGGIPGAAWLGYYNHTLYGGILRSGYGSFQVFFDLAYAPASLGAFAGWLAVLLPAILLVLPLGTLFVREFRTRSLAALALWFGATIGLFACVGFSHEAWWSLRYILPAIPALILAALLGLQAVSHLMPADRRPALLGATAAFVVLWSAAGCTYWTRRLGVYYVKVYEQAYADATRAARHTFPKGALVATSATSGALYAYTDFAILRADLVDPSNFARIVALAHAGGRPVCALLFDSEEKEIFRDHCPGEWERVTTIRNLGLWQLRATPSPPN